MLMLIFISAFVKKKKKGKKGEETKWYHLPTTQNSTKTRLNLYDGEEKNVKDQQPNSNSGGIWGDGYIFRVQLDMLSISLHLLHFHQHGDIIRSSSTCCSD